MVVDTSALVAYILREPPAARLVAAIRRAPVVSLSAAGLVECTMVLVGRQGPDGSEVLDDLIERLGIEVVPVTVRHAQLARAAFLTYGKGRHPAALNFGDCFSYALARERGEPLLFVGGDFARTDITAAAYWRAAADGARRGSGSRLGA